jgi:PAS domain-containing protein
MMMNILKIDKDAAAQGPAPGAAGEGLPMMMDALPQGVVLLAADQTVRALNPAALSLLGAPSPETIVGRPFGGVVEPESDLALRRFMVSVIGGRPDSVRMHTRTESRLPLDFKGVRFHDERSAAPCVLGVLQVAEEFPVRAVPAFEPVPTEETQLPGIPHLVGGDARDEDVEFSLEPARETSRPAAHADANASASASVGQPARPADTLETWMATQSGKVGEMALALVGDLDRSVGDIGGLLDRLAASPELTDPVRDDLERSRKIVERAREVARRFLAYGEEAMRLSEPLGIDQAIRHRQELLSRLAGGLTEIVFNLNAPTSTVRVRSDVLERLLTTLVVGARTSLPMGGWMTIASDEVVHHNRGFVRIRIGLEGYATLPLEASTTLTRMLEDLGGHVDADADKAPGIDVYLPSDRA